MSNEIQDTMQVEIPILNCGCGDTIARNNLINVEKERLIVPCSQIIGKVIILSCKGESLRCLESECPYNQEENL